MKSNTESRVDISYGTYALLRTQEMKIKPNLTETTVK